MNIIQEKVEKYIFESHKKTNGRCGLSIPSIALELNICHDDLMKELIALYSQKKITTREGINGKLIFKKTEHGRK